MTKNWEKILAEKNWIFFLIKNCNLVNSRPPQRTHKLQEEPSALKKEHPALQNMKILYFFLHVKVIFALLDPDPDPATQLNADPDPQPWFCLPYSFHNTCDLSHSLADSCRCVEPDTSVGNVGLHLDVVGLDFYCAPGFPHVCRLAPVLRTWDPVLFATSNVKPTFFQDRKLSVWCFCSKKDRIYSFLKQNSGSKQNVFYQYQKILVQKLLFWSVFFPNFFWDN